MVAYASAVLRLIPNKLRDIMVRCLFSILSEGPIPAHVAFILDGNRRYANKNNLKKQGMGHKLGHKSLISVLEHCYRFGIRHVTIYAFSIDNFKRRPEEVASLMDILQEGFEMLLKEDSVVNRFCSRVRFAGDLALLDKPVLDSAKKLVDATSDHKEASLTVCVPYTCTDEITRAVEKACCEEEREIGLGDVERRLDTTGVPDPGIIIRSSGETRLSNFLMWQSEGSLLCSPTADWPEISIWHMVWALLNFQRMHPYFERKKELALELLTTK